MTALADGQVRLFHGVPHRIERITNDPHTNGSSVLLAGEFGGWITSARLGDEAPILEGHPWQNDPEWKPGDEYLLRPPSGAKPRRVSRIRDGEHLEWIPWTDSLIPGTTWARETTWGPALTFDATGLWQPAGETRAGWPLLSGAALRELARQHGVICPDDATDEQVRGALVALGEYREAAVLSPDEARQEAAYLRGDEQPAEPLTRDQLIEALIANVPAGLNADAWALAVPRVVEVYLDAAERDAAGNGEPLDAADLSMLRQDAKAWCGGTAREHIAQDLPWQRHYDAALWELRPRNCSGVYLEHKPTLGPYAPHQPRQCVRCGKALPMALEEQEAHEALWGITPLPKHYSPKYEQTRGTPQERSAEMCRRVDAVWSAWRWAVCMAARLPAGGKPAYRSPAYVRLDAIAWDKGADARIDWPRLYREGQRVTALQRLEALRPPDLHAEGWRRVCVDSIERSGGLGSWFGADAMGVVATTLNAGVRAKGHRLAALYNSTPRPQQTPYQHPLDDEVGP